MNIAVATISAAVAVSPPVIAVSASGSDPIFAAIEAHRAAEAALLPVISARSKLDHRAVAGEGLFPDDEDANIPGHGLSNWLLSIERSVARLAGLPEPTAVAVQQ